MVCPKCNRPVADNARFCGECGQPINAGGGGPQATVIPPAAESANFGAAALGTGAAWSAAAAPLPGLIERVKNLLLTPKAQWPVIAAEATSTRQLYLGYIMPLLAVASVMSLLHFSVIGISMPFGGSFRTPLLSGLLYAVASFAFGLLAFYLVALIINALAPTFAAERNQLQALKVTAYSFTPALLGSIFSILPMLSTLIQLLALIYGIYLLYLGLPVVMKGPREKATGYTVTVVLCTLLLGVVLGLLSAATGGFGVYGRNGAAMYGGALAPATAPDQQQQAAAAAVGTMIGTLAAAGQKMAQEQKMAQQNAPLPTAAGAPPADQAKPADAANSAAAASNVLAALGGAISGNQKVDPIEFQSLKALLPGSLPGMQRTNAEGSSQTAMGIKSSSASATYQGEGGARVAIKIADVSGVSGLVDMANAVVQNVNSESDSGFERTTNSDGRTLHEKYDNASKHGEISVIDAKRFAVEVSGDGVDMKSLEQYLAAIDFNRLDAMRSAAVQTH